ncbi:MAG: nitroreductase family protein [Candidatus Methanoplasma sp.]|jgi:nitroreductase|nr:nitroreductase family protein [Candidatus Methanoplasma sp.]
MNRNDVYDAVWKRRSVRKYTDKPIESDKVNALRGSISSLNEASGLTMEFAEEFESFRTVLTVMFKNVRSAIVVKGRTDDPHLREKCGYYGEQMVLEATALGLGTCWVAGFNKRSGSLNTKDDETVVCVISIGYSAEEISGTSSIPDAPYRKTKSISEFLEGNTDVPDWVRAGVKSVQFAPTAMNSQKTRFQYADGLVTAHIPSGKLNMVDLGITKLHFELAAGGKFELGSPGRFTKG